MSASISLINTGFENGLFAFSFFVLDGESHFLTYYLLLQSHMLYSRSLYPPVYSHVHMYTICSVFLDERARPVCTTINIISILSTFLLFAA